MSSKYIIENDIIYEATGDKVNNKEISLENDEFLGYFYKKNKADKIWWVDNCKKIGELLISFDKKKIYNLWSDYPYKFTKEEKEIFDKENPYWGDFFKSRYEEYNRKRNNNT